jgi:FtsP/CotA-like multicopper oxidase with cupredoxin domain
MNQKGLDRRDFLKALSLGVAGGYVCLRTGTSLAKGMGGGGGGCGGGGCGGGGSVIDPPPGAAFKDPVMMPLIRNGNLVDVNLAPQFSQINVNGTLANLMTYNGYFPAPTIQVKKGDILRVKFTNGLPHTAATNFLGFQKNFTNLHTHGWRVSPAEPADAAHLTIAPGQTYNYQYNLANQDAGFCFYHPHYHGLVAEQFWAGLAGALVTEDEIPVLKNYETHILVLKDLTLNGANPAPHASNMDYMQGKEGGTIMVNGQVNPVLACKPGQVQRWRILNASNARFYKLSLSGHSLYLVGTDGHLLDKAYARSQILLSPGERVDVLVKAGNTAGSYKFLSLPYSRMGMMTSPQITLMTLNVQGSRVANSIPGAIDPAAGRVALGSIVVSRQRSIVLSMGMGRGYINGQDFDVNPYTIMSDLDTYEVWTVSNQSNMDHPFHQHVNAAQILSISGADSSYPSYAGMPAWKDTVVVPKMGSVTLLVPVKDYTGMTMFHCHILEHEDIGMMGMWHLMGMEM